MEWGIKENNITLMDRQKEKILEWYNEPEDYKYCPNRGPGDPYGWGIMQLDNPEPVDSNLVWNWQNNVNAGLNLLYNKRANTNVTRSADSAIRWLKRQIAHAIYYNNGVENVPEMNIRTYYNIELDEPYWEFDYIRWNTEHRDEEGNVITPVTAMENIIGHLHTPGGEGLSSDEYTTLDELFRDYINISDYASIIITNNENTITRNIDYNDNKTLYDAVTLKLYNSATHHFVSYVYDSEDSLNSNGRWSINPLNNDDFNYVERICREYSGE